MSKEEIDPSPLNPKFWEAIDKAIEEIRGKPDFYNKLNPYTEGFLNDHFEELERNKS